MHVRINTEHRHRTNKKFEIKTGVHYRNKFSMLSFLIFSYTKIQSLQFSRLKTCVNHFVIC